MSQISAPLTQDRYRAPRAIFWTAFLVRLAYITLGHTFRITPYNHHFEFGWETGRVAASLASGDGYGSPFSGNTGPTTWMVPGFTLLLAGVFKVFGIYTPLSAWVIQAIDSLFQALTVPLVYEMGVRVTNRRTALWAAWIWALYPGIIQYGVKWIWETSLSTMLFAWVLALGMRMRGTGEQPPATYRVRDWALFGLLWGAIAMTNPTLILLAPVQGVWILAGLPQRANLLKGVWLALLAIAISIAVSAPWVVRNWVVFHAFIPTRGNFGAEAAMAWAPDSMGMPWGATVPTVELAPEHQLYARMGERAYVQMRGQLAWGWARAYPAHFWKLVAWRFYMFWASVPHTAAPSVAEDVREAAQCLTSIAGILGLLLALRRRLPAAGLFAWAVVLLPAIYYFIIPGSRFRNPLEPFFAILIVYLFQQTEGRWGFSVPGLRRLWPAEEMRTAVHRQCIQKWEAEEKPMQASDRQQILALLDEGRTGLLGVLTGVTDEMACRIPAPGRWSILGCVEHICMSEDYFFSQIGNASVSATPLINLEREAKMLARGTDRTRRMESPPQGHPAGALPTLDAAVTHFLASRERTMAFVRTNREDLRSKMTWHPVLKEANCHEMLLSIGLHALRHVKQIEEIKAALA